MIGIYGKKNANKKLNLDFHACMSKIFKVFSLQLNIFAELGNYISVEEFETRNSLSLDLIITLKFIWTKVLFI